MGGHDDDNDPDQDPDEVDSSEATALNATEELEDSSEGGRLNRLATKWVPGSEASVSSIAVPSKNLPRKKGGA